MDKINSNKPNFSEEVPKEKEEWQNLSSQFHNVSVPTVPRLGVFGDGGSMPIIAPIPRKVAQPIDNCPLIIKETASLVKHLRANKEMDIVYIAAHFPICCALQNCNKWYALFDVLASDAKEMNKDHPHSNIYRLAFEVELFESLLCYFERDTTFNFSQQKAFLIYFAKILPKDWFVLLQQECSGWVQEVIWLNMESILCRQIENIYIDSLGFSEQCECISSKRALLENIKENRLKMEQLFPAPQSEIRPRISQFLSHFF